MTNQLADGVVYQGDSCLMIARKGVPLFLPGDIEIAGDFNESTSFNGGYPQSIHFDKVIRMTFQDGYLI